MIKKIKLGASLNSKDEAHINLFYLIKVLIEKVNEIVDVVNKIQERHEDDLK